MLVAHHMIHHRGSERRSVLVGSSVHNQRIERLWRDMHRCVTSLFYRLFYYLGHHGHLDPISDTHLYAVHYVYLPRINRALRQFHQASWLYMTLLHAIVTLLGSTSLYYTLQWLYLALLYSMIALPQSTTLYHGSTWLYYTLRWLYLDLLDSTTLYHC